MSGEFGDGDENESKWETPAEGGQAASEGEVGGWVEKTLNSPHMIQDLPHLTHRPKEFRAGSDEMKRIQAQLTIDINTHFTGNPDGVMGAGEAPKVELTDEEKEIISFLRKRWLEEHKP